MNGKPIQELRIFRMIKLITLLFTAMLALLQTKQVNAQTMQYVYDFNGLNIALVNGQDNWQYMGNMNTSNNVSGSANCAIPSMPAPSVIAATVTAGLYTGGKALRHPGNTGNTHCFVTRKNNAAWNYSIAAGSEIVILEFDDDAGNCWSECVNLGYDMNGDGNYSSNCNSADVNEIGIGLRIRNCGSNNIILTKADGTTQNTAFTRPSGWTKYRLLIDTRANGGQGAGYVCYRRLGISGAWTQIAGLQNINMAINPGGLTQANLQNLDGLVCQQEAGGVGRVDNILLTTFKTTLSSNSPVCTNNTLNFTINNDYPGATSYVWTSPTGTTYTSATTSISIATPPTTYTGNFTVTPVSDACFQPSWTIPVTITGPSMPTTNGIIICSGNTGLLSIQSPNATYTYNWYDAATGGSLLFTGATYNVTVNATTTYYVEAVNGPCRSPRTAVTVTYAPITQPSVAPVTICPGNTATLNIQSPNAAYTYSWYADQANTVLLATGTSYTTPVLNANTNYYVVSAFSTCTLGTTASVTINLVPPPIVNNAGLCNTNIATLTVQNPNASFTYNWYAVATGGTILGTGSSYTTPALSANTTYYVEAVSGTCQSVRTPVIVTVSAAAAPVVNNSVICSVATATLTVQNVNAGYIYNWYSSASGGTLLASGSSFTTPVLSTATTYFVEATNGGCASLRVPVDVAVDILLPPVSNAVAVCSGNTALLSVQNPYAAFTYNWYASSSGGIVLGTGINYTTAPIRENTIFYVGSSNTFCNSALTAVYVNSLALDSPRISILNVGFTDITFGWLPIPGATGYLVSVDGGPFMAPGSGNTGTTHTVSGLNNSQTVTISVIALAPLQGCGNSYPGHGTAVTYGDGFYVPSAFAPNGWNRVLRPKLPGGSVLEYFTIFNRWGQRLFTTNKIGEGWDGKWQGKAQPGGAYVWICRYFFAGRQAVEERGTSLLLY